jgi:hypothetical protein
MDHNLALFAVGKPVSMPAFEPLFVFFMVVVPLMGQKMKACSTASVPRPRP